MKHIKEGITHNKEIVTLLMCRIRNEKEFNETLKLLEGKGFNVEFDYSPEISLINVRLIEKRVTYSTSVFDDDLYETDEEIGDYISRYMSRLMEYEIYFIRNSSELRNFFNPVTIHNYFKNIKSYESFINESLLDKLEGPTEDDFINKLRNNPIELFKKSKEIGFLKGIEYAYELFNEMEPNDLFYQGVWEKNYDILKYALEHGADVNMNGGFAIRQLKDLSTLNLLIKYGADIHTGDDNALYNAVLYNKYDIILFLIGKGADLYARNQSMIETLLSRQKLPQLKYFIEHKFIEYDKLNDDNKKYAEIYLPTELFNKLKNI